MIDSAKSEIKYNCGTCGAPFLPGQVTCEYCGTSQENEAWIEIHDPEQTVEKRATRMIEALFPEYIVIENSSSSIKFLVVNKKLIQRPVGLFGKKVEIVEQKTKKTLGDLKFFQENPWVCRIVRCKVGEFSRVMDRVARSFGKKITIQIIEDDSTVYL